MFVMNYNELYEILKVNFEKEGNFKTIKDLNITLKLSILLLLDLYL